MAYSNYYAASGLFHGSMSSVMGTQFDILMVGSDPRLLGTVWEKVESEVQRLDKMLNRFDPESEVSFVNREAGHYPVTVGEELWNIFTKERIADLKLSDSSLSISGNMPSHPRHIVNPHTGTFVEDKKMVSVVAKDPVVAEILTTAFMICGDERVPVIASQFDIYEKHVYKL